MKFRGGLCALVVACGLLAGCERMKPKPPDVYVYVTAKQGYLRDRVAAVSNRTGQVQNGDKLKVLDHVRKFLKVQTAKGEVGWIEERSVAAVGIPEAFEALQAEHLKDLPVATATVSNEVYLHLKPGRDSDKFYRLAEGEKLKLLSRAALEKTTGGAAVAAHAQRAIPQAAGTNAAIKPKDKDDQDKDAPAIAKAAIATAAAAKDAPVAPPPVMEDWWLVRDSQGHTGWMLSAMLDVDIPDAVASYAEEQRFVGSYVLSTVNDPEARSDDKNVPIYVTVLMGPHKRGLGYDFDQVRVFTWSKVKHRYETGFREKNIEGFLPVTIIRLKDPYGKSPSAAEMLPGFTYRVLAADAPMPMPDAETGAIVPGKTVTRTYRMEGNYMHRITVPGVAVEAVAHPVAEEKKEKKEKKDGKGKKKR